MCYMMQSSKKKKKNQPELQFHIVIISNIFMKFEEMLFFCYIGILGNVNGKLQIMI